VPPRQEEIAEVALAGAITASTDVGPMLVHGHDPFITPTLVATGSWEPELRDAIVKELRPGMAVADIGANVGYFVRVMSQAVGASGHVTAVEPDPGNLALLRHNTEQPPAAPITVVPAAAWDTPGSVTLARCDDNTGDHRVTLHIPEREVVTVDTVVLDDLLPDGIDLLLLDTQGVEHIILRGATRLLNGHRRPVVFAEFWPAGLQEAGTDPLDVLREYRAAGLDIAIVEGPGADLGDDATPEELLDAILAIEPERFGTLRLQAKPQPRASRWAAIRARRARAAWAVRHPAPDQPWTFEYNDAHRKLVAAAATDPELTASVAAGKRLPGGYGTGFDERVVEYPWLFGNGISGRVLDAGSTFNHPHILDLALPLVSSLTITTLKPEPQSFPERGVSYVFGDLRALPFRDNWFDTTVSISTLEHVGMDNSVYGTPAARAADADREVAVAAAELRRVTRPGGRILVTVPYGLSEDHGWFRQFADDDVQRLIAAFGPARSRTVVYRYSARGWQRSSLRRAADAAYRDFTADPSSPAADRAAAARAVACIAIEL
jgi:FkbM family methyltransferase